MKSIKKQKNNKKMGIGRKKIKQLVDKSYKKFGEALRRLAFK